MSSSTRSSVPIRVGPIAWTGTRLARKSASISIAATAVVCGALFASTFLHVSRLPAADPRPAAIVQYVRQNQLDHSALLVPAGYLPTIHYYFPAARLRSYEGGVPLASDFAGEAFDAVLYADDPVRFERPAR